jgi:hypothetical protein
VFDIPSLDMLFLRDSQNQLYILVVVLVLDFSSVYIISMDLQQIHLDMSTMLHGLLPNKLLLGHIFYQNDRDSNIDVLYMPCYPHNLR